MSRLLDARAAPAPLAAASRGTRPRRFLAGEPGGKAPRADRVERVTAPVMLVGEVESFDTQRRYGFIMGSDRVSYHLHESEVVDGRLPISGKRVIFFPGLREGRPRACHVQVCR